MRALVARLRPLAPFVLRVMIGVLAISFAMGKVFAGMGQFYKEVAAWGLPQWVAQALTWASLAGGFLLVLGLLTRLAALACAAVTVVIVWKTKLHAGFGGGLDFPLLTFVSCLSLMLSGAGRPSLDAKLFGRFVDGPAAPPKP